MNESKREFFGQIGAALGIPLLPTDVIVTDGKDGHRIECLRGERRLWFIDINRVRLEDLVSEPRQDKIIRCHGDPRECVMVYGIPHVADSK